MAALETREEIEGLEGFIQEASVRAGEAISEGSGSRSASDQGRQFGSAGWCRVGEG